MAGRRAKSVAEAAATGKTRELLIAMRDRIAETVSNPDCPPRDLAALTRRLHEIAKDLDEMGAREPKGAGNDDDDGAAPDEDFDPATV